MQMVEEKHLWLVETLCPAIIHEICSVEEDD